jgi:DNA-binding MarR family transcriptional regulator
VSPSPATRRRTQPSKRWTIGQALFGLAITTVRNQPRDMSLTSLSTLSVLDRSGPRRVTDLAVVEGVTQPSMTALVSGLERAGLVERRADPTDRRVALVALTNQGLDYMEVRRQASVEAFVQLIGKLPPEQVDALNGAIPALRQLLELDEERRDPACRPGPGRLNREGQ